MIEEGLWLGKGCAKLNQTALKPPPVHPSLLLCSRGAPFICGPVSASKWGGKL